MRGKLIQLATGLGKTGITPAGAGKTYVKYDLRQAAPDHPRRCGENILTADNTDSKQGSPPRMRGKPEASERSIAALGITPADAGKTF